MKKILFTTLSIISFCGLSFSQNITQTVKGKIFDKTTQETLIGATIILLNSDPLIGTPRRGTIGEPTQKAGA